jgi:flagellar FliL protein
MAVAEKGIDMSDEAAPEPPKPTAGGGAKTSKIVVLFLVLNLGASGFAVFKMMTAKPAEAATEHKEAAAPVTSEVTGPVVPFDPFVVNLDEPGTSRYLKCTIQAELADPEAEHAIEKSKQVIRDAVLSHLSGLHVKDTLGASAKDQIRADLMAKIEKVIGPNKVRRMFFQEFVVQ